MTLDELYEKCLKNKDLVKEFNRLLGYSDAKVIGMEEWKRNFKQFVEEFIYKSLDNPT